MVLEPALVAEMVSHAREDAPLECCGLLGMDGDRVVRSYRARNDRASKMAFEVNGKDYIDATFAAEDEGLEIAGIYHSHPRTEPAPSQTDINNAEPWPGMLWVIVGLEPEEAVRSFRIADGQVTEL